MKAGKCLLLLMALTVGCGVVMAQKPMEVQAPPYPAKWRFNLKRSPTNEYELIFHLDLSRGWHVRVLDEGDTAFHSPEFSFNRNEELKLIGDVKQEGIVEKVRMDSLHSYDVYSYKVLYKQKLEAKTGTKISGRYTYQICNDHECLPLKTEKFAFTMRE